MIKSGIYKMYWNNNEYYYYGQAVKLSHRKSCHISEMLKGKHKNAKIQSIFNKHGLPEFEIVERCEVQFLDEREQHYIDIHHGNKFCCNINRLATSSKGTKQSPETIEKNRLSHLNMFDGEKNPFYGKKHSEETRKKISQIRTGKKYPKLAESRIGMRASDETKNKLSRMRKYGGTWKAKLVLDTQYGIFYSCAKEVSDLHGISHATLRSRLRGRTPNDTNWIYA